MGCTSSASVVPSEEPDPSQEKAAAADTLADADEDEDEEEDGNSSTDSHSSQDRIRHRVVEERRAKQVQHQRKMERYVRFGRSLWGIAWIGTQEARMHATAARGPMIGLVHALERGADASARSLWMAKTALMRAAAHERHAAVSLLISNGADPNARDWLGRTALWFAMGHARQNARGHASILTISALLEGGATVAGHGDGIRGAKATERNRAAVLRAIRANRSDLLRVMLAAGMSPDIECRGGRACPLVEAVRYKRHLCVKALLIAGADKSVVTPTMIAKTSAAVEEILTGEVKLWASSPVLSARSLEDDLQSEMHPLVEESDCEDDAGRFDKNQRFGGVFAKASSRRAQKSIDKQLGKKKKTKKMKKSLQPAVRKAKRSHKRKISFSIN